MVFHEKLDFLMNITTTSNSTLALYTALDASYISRLRRGERKPAKNENYLKKMSGYFSRHLIEDYQKKALKEKLYKPQIDFNDYDQVTELIYNWLSNKNNHDKIAVEGFLKGISHLDLKMKPRNISKKPALEFDVAEEDVSIHYGLEGKREAVISFLNLVINSGKKDTLLLFSDEDMEWLNDDHAFAVKWAKLLSQVIMKGNRIRIIHTVSRNLDEMLEALAKWMPLYMTGAIEPYFYPKKRDGIFKRTLFVAPKTAAVISNSIGDTAVDAANFLLKEQEAISAITNEFNSFFALCRPLMRIYTSENRLEYLKMLHEFENEQAAAVIKTDALSLITMPEAVLESIVIRSKSIDAENIYDYFSKRKQALLKSLRENQFTEIIRIPDIGMIKEGKVRIGFSGMFDVQDLYYTQEEYKAHLEGIMDLLCSYNNYNIFINKKHKNDGYILYVKEELGAIVVKIENPSMIFAINESNMTAAFWDYLNIFEGSKTNKKSIMKYLQNRIDEID